MSWKRGGRMGGIGDLVGEGERSGVLFLGCLHPSAV